MRDEVATAGELSQRANRLAGVRGPGDVVLRDARELGDLGWDGMTGVNVGLELGDGLAPTHADGGDFEQRAARRVEARGLGVEHDDFILDEAELQVTCAFGKLTVHAGNVIVRSRDEEFVESYFT